MPEPKTQDHPIRPSNTQRAFFCPPSIWRELEMPDTPSDVAERGTRIHRGIVIGWGTGTVDLPPDEFKAVGQCLDFVRKIIGHCPAKPEMHWERSIPIQALDGERIFERDCTPDLVIVWPDRAVIIDWKTGWAEPSWPAAEDWQLMAYAVAVRQYYCASRVEWYRYHPMLKLGSRATAGVISGVMGSRWTLYENALKQIVRMSTPEAQAVPGEIQCKWCRAKAICPEFREWAETPVFPPPALIANNLPAPRVAELLDYKPKLKMLNDAMKMIEAQAQTILMAGGEIPGWRLQEGNEIRQIPDGRRAFMAINDFGVHLSIDDFWDAVRTSAPDLTRLFAKASGLKGKAAGAAFAAALGDLLIVKRNAPTLVRVAAEPLKIEGAES